MRLRATLLGFVMVLAGAGPATAKDLVKTYSGSSRSAFALGLRAYAFGLPLLDEQRVITNFPADELINITALTTPAQRLVVLPNVDTLYTVARLRVGNGPLVLHVPAEHGRYYTMQFIDAYTNSFAYVGRRTTGTGPGDYVLAGPRFRGTVPHGAKLIRSPTPVVWLLGRTLVKSQMDIPAVNAIQHGYTLARLGSGGSRAPLPSLFIPGASLKPKPLPTGLAYFDAVGAAMRANPPRRRDRPLLRQLRRVGVGTGLRTSRAKLSAAARAGLRAAAAAGPSLVDAYAARELRRSARTHDGWLLPPRGVGNAGTNYLLRAYIADAALGANVRAEAIYPVTSIDAAGRTLTGAHRYRLHFAAGRLPPVKAFWSLTMYGADRFLTPNAIDRYALGNRSPGLRRNADGSLDIYLQHAAPAASRAGNWLPAPAGRFSLSLRLYQPGAAALADRWPLPRVIRTG